MKNSYFKKNSKKICFSLLGGIVFFGTIIGSGFGISHYTHAQEVYTGKTQTQYNTAPIMDDHYQIVMKVNGLEESDYSLTQLASGVDQGFDVAGVDQAVVLTSNNDELMINLPLNWIDDENPFSFESIEQLQKGLAIAYGYSFVNESLDFRTLQGDSMFKLGGGDGANYDYQIVDEAFAGEEITPEESAPASTSLISPAVIEDDTGYRLISSSSVKYNGGQAYFKLDLNDDDYLDLAIDASSRLVSGSQSNSMLGTAYMWTGYNIYSKLVSTFDSEGLAMARGASESQQITIQGEADPEDPEAAPTETAFTVDPLLIYAYMDPDKSELMGSAQIDQENITKRTSAKPFLLSETQVRQSASVFNKGFIEWNPIQTLSSNEAKLVNEKINYAANSSLSFDYISSSFIYNEKNENSIKILFWTYGTIIILLALFIMWYLGLLGVIADLILSLLIMIFVMIGASSGVAAGFLFISTIFFFVLVTCWFIILVANKFKYNNDESTTPYKKYKKNLLEITNNNLIPLGLILVFLFIFGLIAPLWIGVCAFLAIIFLTLSVTFIFGFYALILYKLDSITKYSTVIKQNKFTNWNLMTGSMVVIQGIETERYYNKIAFLQSEAIAKTLGIVLVFATIITFGFFGVVAGVMGSGVNGATSEHADFRYNVVMQVSNTSSPSSETLLNPIVEETEDSLDNEEYLWYFGKNDMNEDESGRQNTNTTIPWVDTNSDDPNKNGYLDSDDPYGQEDIFALGAEYESDIVDIFNSNNVKVQEAAMVRNDHFGYGNKGDSDKFEVPYWEYGFGYQITSYDTITEDQNAKIEEQLNNFSTTDLEVKNGYNISEDNIQLDFSMQEETGSTALKNDIDYKNINTVSLFTPYTQAHDGYQILLALLAAVFAMLVFAWIMYGWTDMALMFVLLLGELILAFMLVFILWIPFGISFWLALSGLGLLSIISKLIISSKAIKDIKIQDSNDLNIYKKSYITGAKKLLLSSLIFWGFGFAFFAIAIAYVGTAAIAGMCIFFIIPPLIILINLIFYPYLGAIYHHKKDQRKQNRIAKDIEDSLDPKQLSEEYISGVNM